MIELKNVTKVYKMGDHAVHALRNVSLTIESGDFVAIMGPSGSGKSTLAQILGLLDVPTSGSYRLQGKEVSQLSEDELAIFRREEIGFVFQQFHLLARMNALENVTLPLLYSKKEEGTVRATQLMERVGLSQRIDHRPNELSGGQQQRVAIARSLVNQPRMILADEPTGNLDSASEKEILETLHELNNQGITVIMVTHEEEIGLQAKRVIRVRDGLIQSDERRSPLVRHQPTPSASPSHQTRVRLKDGMEHFKQGFKTLAANKVRTGLSMLGILIGVAAVVAMLALGRGAKKAIEGQLASLGSNLLILRSGSMRIGGVTQESGATARLNFEDSLTLKEQIKTIRDVSANVNGRVQATYLNKNWSTQTQGTSPAYATMRASRPEAGRFFTEEENRKRARVAVIGATVVHELFQNENPIGEMIKLNKVPFQVIGVLPMKGSNGWRDQDDIILIPVLTAMYRLLGKEHLDSIEIEVQEAAQIESTQKATLELMNSRKRVALSQQQDAFQIRNMAEIQAALSQSSQTMSVLLASIAAISLLVGGIGIMNIMLVSVTERTREIGLRKAVGARRQDILLQFLAESIVVSAVGGTLGILLGCAISAGLSALAGWATSISPQSVLLSFLFSASIGILFGIYPAKKASLLNPMDALRYE